MTVPQPTGWGQKSIEVLCSGDDLRATEYQQLRPVEADLGFSFRQCGEP
jgi:hypothetical protein